jgi:hypothetical protein
MRRSADLSQKVSATLDNINRLPSDWDALKNSTRKWAKSFETLVERPHLEENGAEAEPTIFSVLTSGMDETLDSLRDIKSEKPTEQTQQRLEQLEDRIAYHTESIALILAHFER